MSFGSNMSGAADVFVYRDVTVTKSSPSAREYVTSACGVVSVCAALTRNSTRLPRTLIAWVSAASCEDRPSVSAPSADTPVKAYWKTLAPG